LVPENDQKMTYIGEKTRQKCLKIFNKTLTDFSFDIPRRGMTKREVGGVVVVVRDRDQHASTLLISIPALSEPSFRILIFYDT
jgi:hypothetical protein